MQVKFNLFLHRYLKDCFIFELSETIKVFDILNNSLIQSNKWIIALNAAIKQSAT